MASARLQKYVRAENVLCHQNAQASNNVQVLQKEFNLPQACYQELISLDDGVFNSFGGFKDCIRFLLNLFLILLKILQVALKCIQ